MQRFYLNFYLKTIVKMVLFQLLCFYIIPYASLKNFGAVGRRAYKTIKFLTSF